MQAFQFDFSSAKDIRFGSYWKQNILPKIQKRTPEIEKDLPKYNVVSEVEKHLGYALSFKPNYD